jgi:hypothetical protein
MMRLVRCLFILFDMRIDEKSDPRPSVTPIIGKIHLLRDGSRTKKIVSSCGVCHDPDRYPFMEEGNKDPVACWATKGEWDDRGSVWSLDIVGALGDGLNSETND